MEYSVITLNCFVLLLTLLHFGSGQNESTSDYIFKSVGDEHEFICQRGLSNFTVMTVYNDERQRLFSFGSGIGRPIKYKMELKAFDNGTTASCSISEGVHKNLKVLLRPNLDSAITDKYDPSVIEEHEIKENETFKLECGGYKHWIKLDVNNVNTEIGYGLSRLFTVTSDQFDGVKLLCLDNEQIYSIDLYTQFVRKIVKVVIFKHA